MRRLLLLRHAKSSWANPEIEDHDRALNKRGKRGAKALACWFADHPAPEIALVSSARRTRETWEALGLDCPAEMRDSLYHADPETLLAVIGETQAASLLVVGHNPGLAEVAHLLAATPPDHPRWQDYPTGALTDLRFAAEIAPHAGEVAAFLTPHDLVPQA